MADITQQFPRADRRNLSKHLSFEKSAKEQTELLQCDAPFSEAECAIAWAEALQEVISVLELQLAKAETELEQCKLENEILRETPKLSPPPTPGRSAGATSLKSLVDQLQASQIEEARRQDKEKTVQQELSQAREEAARYRQEAARLKVESARLRADLQVERSHTQQMIAKTSELQGLLGHCTESQQMFEQQLQKMSCREREGRAQVAELQRRVKEAEAQQNDEKVQWLEQRVAEAQAKAIEERNRAAKLSDENQNLHVERQKMQKLLGTNAWGAPPGRDYDRFTGYNNFPADRGVLTGESSKKFRDTCAALVELRDMLMRMPDSKDMQRAPAAALGIRSYGHHHCWGESALSQDLMSHSIKAINGCVEQLGHLVVGGDPAVLSLRHRHSISSGQHPSRAIEMWGN